MRLVPPKKNRRPRQKALPKKLRNSLVLSGEGEHGASWDGGHLGHSKFDCKYEKKRCIL